MSRVGKKPVIIPSGVDVKVEGQNVQVKGPKGELTTNVHPLVKITQTEEDGSQVISLVIEDETNSEQRSQWGTARSNIFNLVEGVTEGFSKQLEVNGVGYRVNLQGDRKSVV